MATIDLKLKSYDELQFEIMRLITDNYLKQKQIDQLTNNWNELEEWLKNEIERFKEIAVNQGLFIDKELSIRLNARIKLIENILDKMKEIKNNN